MPWEPSWKTKRPELQPLFKEWPAPEANLGWWPDSMQACIDAIGYNPICKQLDSFDAIRDGIEAAAQEYEALATQMRETSTALEAADAAKTALEATNAQIRADLEAERTRYKELARESTPRAKQAELEQTLAELRANIDRLGEEQQQTNRDLAEITQQRDRLQGLLSRQAERYAELESKPIVQAAKRRKLAEEERSSVVQSGSPSSSLSGSPERERKQAKGKSAELESPPKPRPKRSDLKARVHQIYLKFPPNDRGGLFDEANFDETEAKQILNASGATWDRRSNAVPQLRAKILADSKTISRWAAKP